MPRLNFRQFIILLSSAVALFYILYRAIWTLNLSSPYAVFASLFLYVGELYGVLTMVLYFLQVWDTTEPPEKPVLPNRTVDVFVPTYNEDPDLLRVTLRACVAMTYPHRTYLCDDGGTEARLRDPEKGPPSAARAATLKAICEEVGAIYLTRPENSHAKAGNLNHAFTKTDGEFIIIFDADHVPDPNFISRLIGYFEDEKLGFVQTPHAFYNFDSFQARLDHRRRQYWEEGQLFYHVIQPGRNHWNAPIFAGSAAMFRRQALAEVGYIATETITEDMHTGLRMHSRGWKSQGLSCRMISGQAAQDVTTFHSQRLRWGEGNLSVLAHDNPLTLRGLGWGQRLCYFATMINWCGGLFKLPIYLTPLLMLLTGIPPVKEFTWWLAAVMVAYMTVSILGTKYVSNGYGSVWYSELFTMASFWTQIRGTMRALFLRKLQQFVVTAKRGRQSKSIWPFIRPQVYLIVVSVLALLWAWGRLWAGISDDYFKPILATFWALFHILLAYLVVRRALWPEDRRYSTRHVVHLPVAYERDGVSRRLGVTADLNELGVGFVAYEELAVGSTLQLSIHAPGKSVTVEGVIKNARKLIQTGAKVPEPLTGYRYGVAFQNLDAAQTDALHQIGLHYAVPRLYDYYGFSHLSMPRSLWGRFARRFLHRRFAERREYHLPLFLQAAGSPEPLATVTEDLSRTSAAVLVHENLSRGTEVSFVVASPGGELHGRGKVRRTSARLFAAATYWQCVLEFTHFEGQGWTILQTLLGGGPGGRLRPVLKPIKAPMPVPVNRPLAAALLLITLMGAVEFALGRWVYRDDFFLKAVAQGADLGADEMGRLERIFRETMAQRLPSTDRLVLLSRAYRTLDRPNELAEVTKLLAPRDKDNFDLQLGLVYAYDRQEDYDQAVAVCQRLLAGAVPTRRREELLLATARAYVHAGDLDHADEYFRRLLEDEPDNRAYRNELAGVLLSGRRLAEADQLYQGIEPDHDGRVLLVMIHAASKQYARAAQEARGLLQQQPGDPAVEELLADILSMQDNHLQAQAIYQRLASLRATDVRIAIQLAHGAMWNRNYQEALDRFETILEPHVNDAEFFRKYPQVVKAFVNAAASAPRISDAQRATLLALYDRRLTDAGNDIVYLTRLSWVLTRLGEKEKSAAELERAAALEPTDPALRRQIASGFVAAGRPEDALKILQGYESDLDARLVVIDSYVVAKNLPAAAQACRQLLTEHPQSVETRLRLANILSWNKEYKQSLALFDELAASDPRNPLYRVRRAEVLLWSGQVREALGQFEKLLAEDFDRPVLWWDFVDAASPAPSLTDSQVRVAQAICEKTLAGEHRSSRVVETFRKEGKPLAEDAYLTRLAWVMLHHVKDPKKANSLLDKALTTSPEDPTRRKELAGVLAAAGRGSEALRLYQGLALDVADQLNVARIQAGAGDFATAAEQCRAILRKQPLDKDAQVVLADVLSWGGQSAESAALFDKLVKAFPDDEYLRRRQAEVVLWSGDRVRALGLLQALLEAKLDQPALWPSYLEAAGEVDPLAPAQAALAKRIIDQPVADQVRNVDFLARAAWVLYRHLNDRKRAAELLHQAVVLKSNDPVVLSRLAWVLHRTGDKAERDRVLREALALGPRQPAAVREIAGVLVATGHFTEARGLYEALGKTAPRDAGVQAALAEVTLWAGDPAGVLERLVPLLEADVSQPRLCRTFVDAAAAVPAMTEPQLGLLLRLPDGPLPAGSATEQALYLSRMSWALWRTGERLQRPDLRARAGTLLDRAIALKPPDPAARQELAGVLVAAGRPKDALPWLEEAARLHPGDAAAQARLAQVTVWAGEARKALERLQPLLEAQFDQPALWVSFVDAAGAAPRGAMTAHQIELAQRIAARPPPKEAPDPVRYRLRLAGALYREGRKDVAAGLLTQATAQPPRDNETRWELAGVWIAAGRHAEALGLIEELARANPGDRRFQGLLAQATLWSGNAPRALERLQTLLEANFEQPELWVSWVDAAAGLDKGRLTREQLQTAVRLAGRPVPAVAPDKVLYLSRLAWVLHREEFQEKAGALLDQAVALQPSDPKVRRELAGVLVAAGKNEAGLRLYEGLTLDLEDRFQLVVLHAAARHFGEAEAQCQTILKDRPGDLRARQWLADIALWSNQYARALELYQALLAANFEQPRLWPRYVEAISFADQPTEQQVQLAMRICGRFAQDVRDPLLLGWMALVQHRHLESRVFQARLGAGVVATMAPVGLIAVPLLCPAAALADQSRETTARTLLRRAVELRLREPTVLARLSWIAYQMDQPRLSAQVLDEAIALRPSEPAVRREVGDVLVATGRLQEGRQWFEDLAAAFPMNRDFQIRLAEVTVWAGDFVKGLERVEQALGANLEPQSLWHTFVDAASSAPALTPSQIQVALRLAGLPIPVAGVDAQAVYLSRLSWSLFREGERGKRAAWTGQVNALLDRALGLQPRAAKVRSELAGVLTATRRFKDAVALYEGLLRENPGDADLRVRLAEVTLWGGDTAGGLARFEELLRDNVQRPGVWKGFAEAAAAAPALTGAQTELALRLADQAAQTGPGERIVLLSRLARALSREGTRTGDGKLLARADAAVGQALKLEPEKPQDCRELASVLASTGKTGPALELLDKAGAEDVVSRMLRISILADQKDLDRAEMEARALAREKPDVPDAQILLAEVLSWNKKYDEATALFEKLHEANRDDQRLLRRLAEVALWAGQYDRALGRYLRLLDADWNQPDLWPGYIDAASGAREVSADAHKSLVLRICERVPPPLLRDSARLARLAWVLRRLGEPRKSLGLLRQALELDPASREVRARLAETLQEVGEFAEAERHYAVLLKTAPKRP